MRISDWSSDVCSSDLPPAACLSCRHGQPGRDRTAARARRTLRRARRTHPPAGRREPQPAPAARTAGRRTLAAAGEERAGAFARRGDDRPAQVIGAAHVSASEPASIRVLDREYTVGVEPGERDSLMTAAKLLDARMREVRGANRMAAVDRVAVAHV